VAVGRESLTPISITGEVVSVEIVSHCWSQEDRGTVTAVKLFEDAGLNVRLWILPESHVKSRAIGRNMAAKTTEADVIWFTDCDVLFRGGAVDSLCATDNWTGGERLLSPTYVYNTKSREIGDEYIDRVESLCSYDVQPIDFTKSKISRASGAYQIVSGDMARKYGYVPAVESHQEPFLEATFKRNLSDVTYRRHLSREGVAWGGIEVPNVYRIRHSVSGTISEVSL
jgi:hypothetical protein